jgi:hypothetical protein
MLYESCLHPGVEIIVAEHALKHGLTERQIRYAWGHYLAMQHRRAPAEDEVIAIGHEQRGRLVQLVAIERKRAIIIYHAMSPPTRRMLAELGLRRR